MPRSCCTAVQFLAWCSVSDNATVPCQLAAAPTLPEGSLGSAPVGFPARSLSSEPPCCRTSGNKAQSEMWLFFCFPPSLRVMQVTLKIQLERNWAVTSSRSCSRASGLAGLLSGCCTELGCAWQLRAGSWDVTAVVASAGVPVPKSFPVLGYWALAVLSLHCSWHHCPAGVMGAERCP